MLYQILEIKSNGKTEPINYEFYENRVEAVAAAAAFLRHHNGKIRLDICEVWETADNVVLFKDYFNRPRKPIEETLTIKSKKQKAKAEALKERRKHNDNVIKSYRIGQPTGGGA